MDLNIVNGHCSAVIMSIMKSNLSNHCAGQETKKPLLEKEREDEVLAFCVCSLPKLINFLLRPQSRC